MTSASASVLIEVTVRTNLVADNIERGNCGVERFQAGAGDVGQSEHAVVRVFEPFISVISCTNVEHSVPNSTRPVCKT